MLLGLVLQIVGYGGEEGAGTLQATLDIATQHVFNKVDDVKNVLSRALMYESRQQTFDEATPHLLIGVG